MVLAIWFGSLTSLGELSLLALNKYLFGQFILLGPQVVWMNPVANLFIFSAAGLGLCLASWFWRRVACFNLVVWVFAFLGFSSLVLMYHPSLHKYAGIVLAVGLAVQVARMLTAHAGGFLRFVRRTTAWMVVSIALMAAGVHLGVGLAERRALALLPPAPREAPNVLLIVLDTVRAQSLSLYGYDRPTTPQLKRFAKTGVIFERALSTSPWTLPSHASMFTGRYPHETSANWQSALDTTHPTLAQFLNAHGYVTAGFTANLVYGSSEHGLNRGFLHFEDFPISLSETMGSSSLSRFIIDSPILRRVARSHEILARKTAPDLNKDFLDWLATHDSRPFFAFLNYFDAHEPYLPPSPFDRTFGPERRHGNESFMNLRRNAFRIDKWRMSPHEIRAERNAYDGAIAYLDRHLGDLLGALDKRGVLDNTLVIITSDHGEQLGEHGLFDHGNSLYLPLIHVPLLISFPGRLTADFAVSEPVTLRDLPATVVDLVGLKDSSPFPGVSLRRYWDRSGDVDGARESPLLSELSPGFPRPAFYPVSKGEMKSLVVGQYHYIVNGDGREELYDFIADPSEINNLKISGNTDHVLDTTRHSLTRVFECPAS